MSSSKHRSIIDILDFPVFGSYVLHIEITTDMQASLSKYPQTKSIDADRSPGITVYVKNEGMGFIFLKHRAGPGEIAHEAWHAVKHMLEYFGVDLDSEVVAYHLGYIVDRIHKLRRRNGR